MSAMFFGPILAFEAMMTKIAMQEERVNTSCDMQTLSRNEKLSTFTPPGASNPKTSG